MKANPMPLMRVSFTITELIENGKISSITYSGPGYRKERATRWLTEVISTSRRDTCTEIVEFLLGIIGKLLGLFG